MAHQAHNITWNVLVSNMKVYLPKFPDKQTPNNLYFQSKPSQVNDIRHFATSFIDTIQEHTRCERKKYPAKINIPKDDDVLLDDATTLKISPLVYEWRQAYNWDLSTRKQEGEKSSTVPARRLCTHDDGFNCRCAIPQQEKKAIAFLRRCYRNDCGRFYKDNRDAFYNIELVKTLLLYGKMEPILRICTHPDVDYEVWHEQAQCYDTVNHWLFFASWEVEKKAWQPTIWQNYDAGWDQVYKSALRAYLCLNILYCFPSLWDSALADYRSTKLYQRTLRVCTYSGGTSVLAQYPHKAFFGIEDGQFTYYTKPQVEFAVKYNLFNEHWDMWWHLRAVSGNEFPYGVAPIEEVHNSTKDFKGNYLPDRSAVNFVNELLRRKGLPQELILDILEEAQYTVKRRLALPHDPFHPENRSELHAYVKYCWKLLINCSMMAEALGVLIDWRSLIYEFLQDHISSKAGSVAHYCQKEENYVLNTPGHNHNWLCLEFIPDVACFVISWHLW